MTGRDVIIRPMTEADLDQVEELERQCFSVPWSRESLAEGLQKDTTVYLAAELEGRTVGYCALWTALDEGEITNVAVSPDARKRGIGAAMMKELLCTGREKGIRAFFLEVRESNIAARTLYKKCGFAEDGIRKNFYEKPQENAVLMSFRD